MRNAFTKAALYVQAGINTARLLHASAKFEVPATQVFETLQTMRHKVFRLRDAFKQEDPAASMIFFSGDTLEETLFPVPPANMNEFNDRLVLSRERMLPLLQEENDLAEAIGRLHFASGIFTHWYGNQDSRTLETVDSVVGRKIAPDLFRAIRPRVLGAVFIEIDNTPNTSDPAPKL